MDTTPPVISDCPETQTLQVELGITSGIGVWTEPTATDLSGVAILTTRTNSPGQLFPVGQTLVMYIFSDASMNEAVCQFSVIVTTGMQLSKYWSKKYLWQILSQHIVKE